MKELPVRILLVGETREARRLRGLLDADHCDGCGQFHIAHAPDLDVAARRMARDTVDVLVVDLEPGQLRKRAFVDAARLAALDVPLIILAESDDESLAVESLRHGAQDFLAKGRTDRAALTRALRFAMERHHLQRKVQSLSLVDDLTGLQNRRGFLALAEQHLRLILRKGSALLIYLDLDALKEINDTYGHQEGNRALVVTANILRSCFRQSDILARLGGDEFCVLMTDPRHGAAAQIRKRMQQRLEYTNALSSWRFQLSWSMGIAEVPADNRLPLEELLRLADSRMYEQKRSGRSAAPAAVEAFS